jgi:molybdopterin/thiamine biosynthesis adenylyltransferase
LDRYSRQTRFAPFGEEGQERLSASTAVIVGCGALGCTQAALLARAGAGTLRLIDRDYVEESNLQRQILYTERDAAEALPKAEAARRHLVEANSVIRVEACVADLNPEDAPDLLAGADVILDATDNFETRYLINDYAVRENIPWIYGAAVGSYGIAMPLCGRNAVQIHERQRPLDLAQLAGRLEPLGKVRANEFALRFDDGDHDITFFADGRAIVKGTTDAGVARGVYSRYIGN